MRVALFNDLPNADTQTNKKEKSGLDTHNGLDQTDWDILTALQQDARLSFAELGRRVGLSPPSVTERVRRMEDTGVLLGYQAVIEPKAIGLELRVLIDLTTTPQQYPAVIDFMKGCAAIQSAHHVTGGASFRVEAFVPSIMELEDLVGQLSLYGQTKTSVVLSSPVYKTLMLKP